MRPLGDTFINLVKMVITPVIFLTIVLGIARTDDLKRVGRVGVKALVYFEIVTTFALAIGAASSSTWCARAPASTRRGSPPAT